MADTDGKVRIIIDTNAEAAAKQLNDVGTAFKKNADTIQKSSTVYGGYEKAVRDNIEVLRELALAGDSGKKGFEEVAKQTREYKKVLDEANQAVNKAVGGIERQSSPVDALTSKLKGLVGAYLGLRGVQAVFNYTVQATEAFRVQERAVLSLNTTLSNAGVYSEQYSKSIQELASQIQSYSNYGDEAIIKAQSLGQAYIGQTKITEQLTKAVVDFAAATGMDLEQAFTLVGKSIGSSTNALGRYGIELKKGMSDSEKMTAIQKQLGQRYNGSARSMANASIQLKNDIGDLAESFGQALDPAVKQTQEYLQAGVKALTAWINQVRILKTNINNLSEISELQQRYAENTKKISKTYDFGQNVLWGKENRDKERRKLQSEQTQILGRITLLKEAQKEEEKLNKNQKGYKIKDEFGDSSAKKAKEVKDAFEQAQAEAQKAEKAFKLALYQSGGNVTPAVEQARSKMVDTKKAVEDVQKAYENLTAKTKTPFEQLNYNIEQSRQKIISLASQPIVNLEAIKQAQTEFQGFLSQQEQINAYLQPAKGAYQQLQDRVTSLTQTLRNLAAENKINTDEWNINKTALDETKLRLQEVDDTLKQTGINTEQVAKSISSSLSSGIINAVRNGGNAFESFSNIAVTALQKVLDKVLEMSVINPILNSITGSIGGGGIFGTILGGIGKAFGFKNGAAFRNGNVIPFARGGVVNKPTVFPMKSGAGLMGEAGAEAIMPLTRKNGKLGVEATNTGAVVNIYNYSGANVETQKRDDGSLDVFIKRVNYALQSEKTSSGFKSAYAREDRKGVQAC